MAALGWIRTGDRWAARTGGDVTVTIARGPNSEYPWRLSRDGKAVGDFNTVTNAKAKAERLWAGRRRSRTPIREKQTTKAESRKRWAEVHKAEREGRPILNPRSYALGFEPARRKR